MIHVPLSKSAEIDRNLQRFLELLPTLMRDHAGQYALMRHGEVVGFYATPLDAQMAGNETFSDDLLFSFQHVTETPEELGFFSYAVHPRTA